MPRILLAALLPAIAIGGLACGIEKVRPPGGEGGGGTGGSLPGGSGGGGSGGSADIGVKYDTKIYDPENLQPPTVAGGKVIDRTFGTTFVRITSENQGACRTPPYGQSAISKDGRWIQVGCDTDNDGAFEPLLIPFDPDSLTLRNTPQVFNATAPEDARFSEVDAGVLFTRDPATNRVLRFFEGANPGLKHSFGAALEAGEHIEQLSMSADDQVIAVARATDTGPVGWLVFDGTAGETRTGLVEHLDRVRVDRSGRYLLLTLKDQRPSDPNAQVMDIETGNVTDVDGVGGDAAPTWFDLGDQLEIGYAPLPNSIHLRDLSAPASTTELIPSFENLRHVIDVSAGAAPFALLAFQGVPHSVYGNELVAAFTDGTGKIARLANHRASSDPHASLSPDGRFVAFTSTLGVGSRTAVYLLVVPPL